MQPRAIHNQTTTLQSIRLLRFFAAISIVVFHAETYLLRMAGGARITPLIVIPFGTDLFFVISGFLMVYVTAGKSLTFRQFIVPRIARLIPLYWLFTSLMLAILIIAPKLFHTTKLDVWHVAASYAFVPYPHPFTGLPRPLLVWGWILNLLIPISVVYAAFLGLSVRKRVFLVGTTLGAIIVLNLFVKDRFGLVSFYGSPISLEFLFGLTIGALYLELGHMRPLYASAILVLGLAILAAGLKSHVSEDPARVWYWGTSSACLLAGLISIEKGFGWIDFGILNNIGDASYSTILSHFFSLGFVNCIINATHLFGVVGEAGSQIFFVVSALAIGSLTYIYVERPWVNFVRRLEKARRDSARNISNSVARQLVR
ncbi:MAG TPA: acyltransferase [Hyphomicrobium sp.]|nr:acyltransferase [Hyphomicrobium sp.]